MRGRAAWIWGCVALGALALGVSSCTTPPTFPDQTNHFITFNPVYLDALPGTSRAFQVRGSYDGNGLAFLSVTEAERDALPRLWSYQLWAVNKVGGVVTDQAHTPKFLWDPVRHLAVQPDGNIIEPRKFSFETDITEFESLVLTIEPYPDYYIVRPTLGGDLIFEPVDDVDSTVVNGEIVATITPEPDLEFLMVSGLSAGQTNYSLRFPTALDLDTASGMFFLANFTGGTAFPAAVQNAANYGLWFGMTDIGLPVLPSLVLPPPPANWVYEGWIIPPGPNPAEPISTGRFTQMNLSDVSDQYSGPNSPGSKLPIPGEDFLQNPPGVSWTFPMNLVSPVGDTGWAFITLEPNFQPFAGIDTDEPFADISEDPFFYRVLQSPLPDSNNTPALNPFFPDSNRFLLENMHGLFPKFGHPGAPRVEVSLSSQ